MWQFICFFYSRWSLLCHGSPTTALHRSKASGMFLISNSFIYYWTSQSTQEYLCQSNNLDECTPHLIQLYIFRWRWLATLSLIQKPIYIVRQLAAAFSHRYFAGHKIIHTTFPSVTQTVLQYAIYVDIYQCCLSRCTPLFCFFPQIIWSGKNQTALSGLEWASDFSSFA